jgi:hypothetical protein
MNIEQANKLTEYLVENKAMLGTVEKITAAVMAFCVQEQLVLVKQKEYDDLGRDSDFLCELENAGVDNWDGYEWAQEAYEEFLGEEE